MLNIISTRGDFDLRFNPIHRSVAVLQRQCLDTSELQTHVEHARKSIDAPEASRIHALLTGLREELAATTSRLQERIESLSPGQRQWPLIIGESQSFWQLFHVDGANCSSHLEALLSGYVRYARSTSESIAFLETLGDQESAQLLKAIFDAADRNIWFLEFYMEGLALRMDLERLPEFAPQALSIP